MARLTEKRYSSEYLFSVTSCERGVMWESWSVLIHCDLTRRLRQTGGEGNKIMRYIMPLFDIIMEELEDSKLYDEAKKEDIGDRMLFSDYLKNRKPKKNA